MQSTAAGGGNECRDGRWLSSPPPGEEVCISGLSGTYPDSESVHKLRDNLLNKVDMVTPGFRSYNGHPMLPKRCGKIKNAEKFDAGFFGLHYKAANVMAINLRQLLERTYEAIVDAGVNPRELKGTRTGVYISSSYAESETRWMYENLLPHGYVLSGVCVTSWATHISYWLGLKGPSYCVDTACSSSFYALDHAYQAIRDGKVDQAIVGGSNMLLNPTLTIQFVRMGLMSPEGKSRAFDKEGDGYARSESIAVIFLQKAKDCKRIYATLVHSKTNNDGYKEQSITYPNGKIQQMLMEQFYEECRIDPASLAWLEAHGTGTRVGDPEEIYSISNVFCKNRTTPLQIGSLKTNLGHSETASGLCSISKVIIAMETGLIPPVLHFNSPIEVPPLLDGRLKVVTEVTPWNGGLVGVSSFGFGGGNSHLLLRSNPKEKVNGGAPSDDIPRLVVFSSRTEKGVKAMLDDVESRPVDVEHVRLLHDVTAMRTEAHMYRGYTLLQPGQTVRDIQFSPMTTRPIWFVFSNKSCQWTKTATSLLTLPVFAKVIDTCHEALKPKQLDLHSIIRGGKLDTWVELFVVGTAVQVGLVEIMRTVGVSPDGFIACSIGKMAASYLSGSCNIQQAILAAYKEGQALVSRDGAPFNGVKASARDVKSSVDGSTSTIGSEYWSSSIVPEATVEKQRDTIVPRDKHPSTPLKAQPIAIAAKKVPRKAILVGMTSLDKIQEMLIGRQKGTVDVPLVDEKNDAVASLLISLGRLYMAGVDLRLANLYPPVEFPVSRGTPMISSLIGWNHTEDWNIVSYSQDLGLVVRERTIEVDISKHEMQFYTGHVVDGRNLFPATGYLYLVWQMTAAIHGLPQNETAVVFEDVKFLRATHLRKDGKVSFQLIIQRVSGKFEVVDNGEPIVTGRVTKPDDIDKEMLHLVPSTSSMMDDQVDMTTRDIYKELRLRGYNYTGIFKSVVSADPSGRTGKIRWHDNWVAFMDNMLQTQILSQDTRALFVPTSIDRLCIHPEMHNARVAAMELQLQEPVFEIVSYPDIGVIRGGGVEIRGMNVSVISKRKPLGDPVLEKHIFIQNTASLALNEALRVCVHVALENQSSIKVKAVEVVDNETDPSAELLSPILAAILGDLPLIQADITVLSPRDHPLTKDLDPSIKVATTKLSEVEDCMFVMGTNVLRRGELLSAYLTSTKGKGFLISREISNRRQNKREGVVVLNEYTLDNETIVLARKCADLADPVVIFVTDGNFEWITALQKALNNKRSVRRIILVSQGEDFNGIMGLFNCVRKEPHGDVVRCVFILDPNAPKFDPQLPFYKSQLEKDLALNVYKAGNWGSYRHLPLESNTTSVYKHVYVNTVHRGDLSSLKWLRGHIDPSTYVPEKTQGLVQVYYAALNFRDVMIASGKLAGEVVVKDRLQRECMLGFEFSGRDASGRRVMGMAKAGCLSNLVAAEKLVTWEVPDGWTLEDAATVPVTYATVLIAFDKSGVTLREGVSLLIHAGSGGVGQTAIHLALRAGCTVYTTVGTQEKRDFIKQRFPQVTDRHIGNSRDSSFEQFVMSETNGRGVDIVLNCLAGELLQASVRCLAVGGRFLEIGKVDMVANTLLDMERFDTQLISFHGILLDLFDSVHTMTGPIDKLIRGCLAKGDMKPLTRTTFASDDVEQAFRYMAAGKHVGKVLVQIRPEEKEKYFKPEAIPKTALPKYFCNQHSSYIIAGGLGGFGLELADWLVLRGARKLVLTSRTGLRTGYQSSRVRTWKSYGITVHISTDDIATEEGVKTLLVETNKLGPVAAIFNLAVVLADAIFENQTPEQFVTSFGPKATATQHMDQLSRRLCPQLEHFVVFSSVSCGRGNAGQTNYGMANSVMERICERRVQEGYPGLAVQWGAVGDVGLVADKMEDHKELVIGGTLQQGISSCLHVLDSFLSQPHSVVASMVVAEKRAGGGGNLVEYVANMLGIRDAKTVSEHATLAELGADSLMVVEMKQALEQEYDVVLSPREIRAMTFDTLARIANAGIISSTDKSYEWNVGTFHFLVRAFADEDAASQPVVELASLASGNEPTLFMMPGLEGMASIFKTLAKKISFKVKGLQLVNRGYFVRNTVGEMALDLLPHLKKSLVPNEPFKLFGYSFGGAVVMELALLLEKEGHRGHVYLLDSSPDFLKSVLLNQLLIKNMNRDITYDENLQVNMLLTMLNYLKAEEASAVNERNKANMTKLKTWNEKVELFLSLLPEDIQYSRDYSMSIINAMWSRLKAVSNIEMKATTKLKSQVTLLRPHYKGLEVDHDYGLAKYCEEPVEIHLIEGDHASIVESQEVADIINNVKESEQK